MITVASIKLAQYELIHSTISMVYFKLKDRTLKKNHT